MKITTLTIAAALLASPVMASENLPPIAMTVMFHAAYKTCGLTAPRKAAVGIIVKAMNESGLDTDQFMATVGIAADEFVRVQTEKGRIGRFCAEMANVYRGEK